MINLYTVCIGMRATTTTYKHKNKAYNNITIIRLINLKLRLLKALSLP